MTAVSVIIPSFNMGWYLRDALASLYGGKSSLGNFPAQTLTDFETIVVDDCSDDGTPKLIPMLERRYARWAQQSNHYLRLEHDQKGKHKTAAMNAGIKLATGEYITILDADDLMKHDRLEKMLAVCRANPHRLVYDDVQWFENGHLTRVSRFAEYNFITLREANLFHVGIMYPKAAWVEVGGYPEEMGDGRDDWSMGVRLGVHGWCGVHLPEAMYLYRREGQGRTLRNTSPEKNQAFYERIKALHPEAFQDPLPEGCCGARVVSNLFQEEEPLPPPPPPPPPPKRAVMVRYIGNNAGTQLFKGRVTRRPYQFGLCQPLGEVAADDVDGFINPGVGEKKLFEVVG
jgi:GT2 family glycosyltransferase